MCLGGWVYWVLECFCQKEKNPGFCGLERFLPNHQNRCGMLLPKGAPPPYHAAARGILQYSTNTTYRAQICWQSAKRSRQRRGLKTNFFFSRHWGGYSAGWAIGLTPPCVGVEETGAKGETLFLRVITRKKTAFPPPQALRHQPKPGGVGPMAHPARSLLAKCVCAW